MEPCPATSIWSTRPSAVKQVGLVLQFHTCLVPCCNLARWHCGPRQRGSYALSMPVSVITGIVDIPHGGLISTMGYFYPGPARSVVQGMCKCILHNYIVIKITIVQTLNRISVQKFYCLSD